MTLLIQVRDWLRADATLAALLPGGIHATGEIDRQRAPGAFDENGEVRPCALVTSGGDAPDGPTRYAGRKLVNVWLYHRTDDAALETAAARVRALLHRAILPGTFEALWAFDAPVFDEAALAARGTVTRYEVIRKL